MRESNFELLRIVSMILVMVLHVTYALIRERGGIMLTSMSGFLTGTVSVSSLVCVNLFVMISGWFSIRFKIETIIKIVFQTVFLSLFTYFIILVLEDKPFSLIGSNISSVKI